MKILNNNAINVIKNNISRYGKEIEFKRPELNEYGEVTDGFEITVTQKCIYHVAADYGLDNAIQGDSGKAHGYKTEMLLTAANENIKIEDYCNVGDKFYRIFSINDYQNDERFIEISLEEVRRESNK